jgi:hypothetical protein
LARIEQAGDGYCQGFIISRLGTTPSSITSGTNSTNGSKVNWTNPQVSSCASPGTTSCIQLRLDAVGYAVNALLLKANSTEGQDGITNQFRVGLYPFIQNLCYANVNSSSSCSVGLTTNLTGSTINNFATQLPGDGFVVVPAFGVDPWLDCGQAPRGEMACERTTAWVTSSGHAGRDVCRGLEIGVDIDQMIEGGGRYYDKRDMAKRMWATIMNTLQAIGALPRREVA